MIKFHSLENVTPRKGCHDIWNAFMVDGAKYAVNSDIPFCTCTCSKVPLKLISYEDAKAIYKHNRDNKMNNFSVNAYVHFYIDDQKFDGKKSSIWLYPDNALEIIKHFSGIITPDFSTNADFPDPIKRFNTYRMRAFGYWMNTMGIPVINNVRWGTEETWDYCFDGIPKNSIVAIGTVASGLKHLSSRDNFEKGLFKMAHTLSPHTIIVYGSARYSFFSKLQEKGITIVSYPSKTSEAFARRIENE